MSDKVIDRIYQSINFRMEVVGLRCSTYNPFNFCIFEIFHSKIVGGRSSIKENSLPLPPSAKK